MSFASLAIGSKEVEATSTAASIAVLTSSATSTNVIASRSTISSSLDTPKATAATSTAAAIVKWIQRFRCVRSAWMTPSTAWLKLWKSEGLRCAAHRTACALARGQPSRRRDRSRAGGGGRGRAAPRQSSPTTAGQRTTSPRARGTPSGSSSRPSSGNESTSVASSMPRCSRLSSRISSRATNAMPSSPSVDAFGGKHAPRELGCLGFADLHPASVLRLDHDHAAPHRLRAVPVSSAWRL